MALQSHVPSPRTLITCETMVKTLSFIATSYMLNQSYEHWFIGNALHLFITKTWEFRDEVVDTIVLNNKGDLKANVFYVELDEFMVHMKVKSWKFFNLSCPFWMGLKRRGVTICLF